MSYYVEYAKCFIKSELGFTPLIQTGDSSIRGEHNSIGGVGWSTYAGLLGASEAEIRLVFERCCTGYEHWKTAGGKWVTDKDLLSWARNGIKHPVFIEDVIDYNQIGSVTCVFYHWGERREEDVRESVRTTEEFDRFILKARELKEMYEMSGEERGNYGASISLGSNYKKDFYMPPTLDPNEHYYIKNRGKSYVCDVEGLKWDETFKRWTLSSVSTHVKLEEASSYSAEMTAKIVKALRQWGNRPVVVKAKTVEAKKEKSEQWVLKVNSGTYTGNYIWRVNGRSVQFCISAQGAHRYSSQKNAQMARDKVNARSFQTPLTVEVCCLPA